MTIQYVIYDQTTGLPEYHDNLESAQARQQEFLALYPTFSVDLFDITVWQTNDDGTITQYKLL
jgi:hypothetical protein